MLNTDAEEEEPVKYKPNFGLTGALAKDERTGNMVNGIVLKHSEPLDSAIPKDHWRLYVFKDDKQIEILHIHRKSSFLFGRDDRVADIITAHPSCSKQHAVLQYRQKDKRKRASDGTPIVDKEIIPYLIDLGSTHKTLLNGKPIEDSRYYELREKDSIKLGTSSREYILLKATSKEEQEEEDEDEAKKH